MAEQIPMGIGDLGFSNMVFKRKFRYTFEVQGICDGNNGHTGNVPPNFVKLAARPNVSIEETEVNYLNAKTWIPGKASWEAITVTYLDVAVDAAKPLYNWLASVYDFTKPLELHQGSQRGDYAGTAIIKMWDGCGQIIEMWTLEDVWPTSIDFGDLDYANSDIAEITLTLRYSQVAYENFCPGFPVAGCCTPCA